MDLQLANGVNQRYIDKENQLKYRLQQIEKQLEDMETDGTKRDWLDVFDDLQRDFFAIPFKWKSKAPSVRNAFLKKYIDKEVYTKNNINPNEPKLEIHYTELVNQAMEVYKQYQEQLKRKVEERKQKAASNDD